MASRIILLVTLSNCEHPYKRRLHKILEFIPFMSKQIWSFLVANRLLDRNASHTKALNCGTIFPQIFPQIKSNQIKCPRQGFLRVDRRDPHVLSRTWGSAGGSARYPPFQHHNYTLGLSSRACAESNDLLMS